MASKIAMAGNEATLDILPRIEEYIRGLHEEKIEFDLDTDMFQSGLVNSLQFVGFLNFLESQRGRPFGEEEIQPEKFASVGRILANFFS